MAAAYLVAVIIKNKELPESISALVYYLPKEWQWVWSVWLLVCGGLACVGLIEKLPEIFKFVGFLTMACIGFTAVMPIVVEDNYKMHNILGISAGILSQLSVMFITPLWLLLWVVAVSAYTAFCLLDNEWAKRVWLSICGKEVLLAEVVCGLTVYCCLL